MEPSVLDKKTLNNYIVSMRNNVTRSKVHTINRMARQAKQLRVKNGTEEQKSKHKKKADRLIQEIMVIKELDKDDVSKFGLTTTQDLKRLQSNMKSPMEIRAIARLCLHKFVATEIKAFKEKYPISPVQVLKVLRTKKKKLKNLKPSVDEEISDVEMQEEKEEISRTSDKNDMIDDSGNESEESINIRISESESEEENMHSEEEESVHSEKEQNQLYNEEEHVQSEEEENMHSEEEEIVHSEEEQNQLSEEEENVQSEEEEMDNDSDESEEKSNIEEPLSDKSCDKSVDKGKDRILITKSEIVPGEARVLSKENVKLGNPIKDRSFSERKMIDSKLVKNNIVLENSDDFEQEEDDEEEMEEFTNEKNQSIKLKTKVKEKKETEEVKVIDPFFMTKENKHYITSQVPTVSNNPEKEFSNNNLFGLNERQFRSDFEEKRFAGFQSDTTHMSERWGSKDNSGKSLADEKHMQKYGFFSQANEFRDGFKNRRERRLNLHKNTDKPQQNEKVQPRFDYERRERKPSKDVQQGIKRFDAKPSNRDIQPFPRRVDAKPSNRDVHFPRRVEPKPEVEKLHPSWEAKKKLPSIAQFQGKKITFDD